MSVTQGTGLPQPTLSWVTHQLRVAVSCFVRFKESSYYQRLICLGRMKRKEVPRGLTAESVREDEGLRGEVVRWSKLIEGGRVRDVFVVGEDGLLVR